LTNVSRALSRDELQQYRRTLRRYRSSRQSSSSRTQLCNAN